MTKKEKELTREFLIPYVTEFKYCFSTTTSKKWKEKFCNDRMENFIEDFSETFTNQTKIKLDDEKNLKDFKKIYKEVFLKEVEDYLEKLAKCKTQKQKDELIYGDYKKYS